MAPAKQAKVIQEFQKQSAQLDMTVSCCLLFLDYSSGSLDVQKLIDLMLHLAV